MAAPFATIEKALAAARGVNKGAGATIVLRAGVYYASDTLALTAADSGLTIMNHDGRSKQTPPLATKNLLENTDGCGSLLLSADVRSLDDVIAF